MKKGDPKLCEAAIRVFGDESLAEHWLTTPLLALADKSPVDADTEDALELLARLEHGFCA
ncbi:antitoxin Xre/MbcA/ParS toxin-binding domain-containing protein [Pseudomonas sp. PSE1(2024)]|uniref:antitoxin Xre/MbcA/ParS toxin-binding domain-containing protein n=1 Tax=Pseudomonas sp. PSE1(2024) TaxID=3228746 RepID=UPI003D96F9AB